MKTAKTKIAAPPISLELPEHVHPTDGELAVFTRLVKVMRQKDSRGAYWLGPFIEWLLYLDNTEPNLDYVPASKVSDRLKEIGNQAPIGNGSPFIKALRRECPGIQFVSRVSAKTLKGKEPECEQPPVDEEEQFYQLLRLWCLEHPEPPKKMQHPSGHLGREESGD